MKGTSMKYVLIATLATLTAFAAHASSDTQTLLDAQQISDVLRFRSRALALPIASTTSAMAPFTKHPTHSQLRVPLISPIISLIHSKSSLPLR